MPLVSRMNFVKTSGRTKLRRMTSICSLSTYSNMLAKSTNEFEAAVVTAAATTSTIKKDKENTITIIVKAGKTESKKVSLLVVDCYI